jgi:dihydrolipoamide dehydrogenase
MMSDKPRPKKSHLLKMLLFLILAGVATFLYFNGGKDYLSLSYLKDKLASFQESFSEAPLKSSLLFFGIYLAATALSFPGAAVLTLLAGAIFGPWKGLLIVSFASTMGSFLAFLASRFLLREFFMKKFHRQFQAIDKNIEKDGVIYLATLRLVPVFPFFVVNIVMGLTSIKNWSFYWVSQLTMLPGTFVYVYAGREFSQLDSLKGILSPEIIGAFVLLGILPLIGKFLVSVIKRRKVFKKFKKPSSFDYNLVAIGAGSAGLVTTYIGSAVKSKVALIEKDKMGGDCLNTGCVPSKALIKSAKVVHLMRRAREFGLSDIPVKFNFSDVMERLQKSIQEIAPHDSVERYQKLGVDCIRGDAKILSPWTIQVGEKTITAKNIVIATGARPVVPNIPGLKDAAYVTSETIWKIRELPEKLAIIGGGPIGVEMAQAFARLGSEVTIIEASDSIMRMEDRAVSDLLLNVLQREGIKILTSHKVQSFTKQEDTNKIICEHQGKYVEIDYDLTLVAIGRKANVTGFGLEELGVKLRENGTIDVNEYLQSNFPNIYACGDVTGPYQLTHMASHQAWYCAVNSLFPKKFKVDYSTVPWCTYTDPEIATVGETERSANEKELDYEVTEYDLSDLDRAIVENEKLGKVRVITKKGSDKILGATIVGSQASSMIIEFVSAMKNKKGMNSILGTIHVYPSFGEANKYAAGNWKKNHVNPRILKLLNLYFSWKRK